MLRQLFSTTFSASVIINTTILLTVTTSAYRFDKEESRPYTAYTVISDLDHAVKLDESHFNLASPLVNQLTMELSGTNDNDDSEIQSSSSTLSTKTKSVMDRVLDREKLLSDDFSFARKFVQTAGSAMGNVDSEMDCSQLLCQAENSICKSGQCVCASGYQGDGFDCKLSRKSSPMWLTTNSKMDKITEANLLQVGYEKSESGSGESEFESNNEQLLAYYTNTTDSKCYVQYGSISRNRVNWEGKVRLSIGDTGSYPQAIYLPQSNSAMVSCIDGSGQAVLHRVGLSQDLDTNAVNRMSGPLRLGNKVTDPQMNAMLSFNNTILAFYDSYIQGSGASGACVSTINPDTMQASAPLIFDELGARFISVIPLESSDQSDSGISIYKNNSNKFLIAMVNRIEDESQDSMSDDNPSNDYDLNHSKISFIMGKLNPKTNDVFFFMPTKLQVSIGSKIPEFSFQYLSDLDKGRSSMPHMTLKKVSTNGNGNANSKQQNRFRLNFEIPSKLTGLKNHSENHNYQKILETRWPEIIVDADANTNTLKLIEKKTVTVSAADSTQKLKNKISALATEAEQIASHMSSMSGKLKSDGMQLNRNNEISLRSGNTAALLTNENGSAYVQIIARSLDS